MFNLRIQNLSENLVYLFQKLVSYLKAFTFTDSMWGA